MQVSIATTVEAPPSRVFAVAADIARWPDFMSAIERVDLLTPGPVAIGARFRETRTMFGRSASEEMTVVEFTPPHRLVLAAHNHGTAYRAEHIFEASGAGTRLRMIFGGVPTSLMARLMAPLGWLFLPAVKRQLAADLADLKREAERGPRA
jgi:uncharacterized protein YndB with AHSA1/START domain